MIGEILFALGSSLIATIVLEAIFFFAVGKRNKTDLLLLILVNVLTNPVVVLLYWLSVVFTQLNRVALLVALELSAIAVEGFIYQRQGASFKRPYLFSTAANLFSFGIGTIVQFLLTTTAE